MIQSNTRLSIYKPPVQQEKRTNFATSTEAYSHAIRKPSSLKYGAPAGRYSNDITDKPTDEKIYNRIVYLDNGGYDKGCHYWGLGSTLRVEYTLSCGYVRFYRL